MKTLKVVKKKKRSGTLWVVVQQVINTGRKDVLCCGRYGSILNKTGSVRRT
jgi:hypothetical protein